MITIDGTYGEGGGQILRTSLALSLVTGKPFSIMNIRGNRKKPGLRLQHLTAVNAAKQIGRAKVIGNEIGSTELEFMPSTVCPGKYHFAIATAGSATLVLQTILPALLIAKEKSSLILEGGTHNPWAPPFDYLVKTFLPIINRMGPKVCATLVRYGFYPAGGGKFSIEISPADKLKSIELFDRGAIKACRAESIVSKLPVSICERELRVLKEELALNDQDLFASEVSSQGPGNAVLVEVISNHVTELFVGFGEKGVKAEIVASRTAKEVQEYISSNVPVGRHLADQLVLPLAVAGGGSFSTLTPSSHTLTNIEVIKRFLNVDFSVKEIKPDIYKIQIYS